ncbi:GNAT family N-acetyltransferase [Sediminispirochaeta bajacaliforniensis]|uniref:GNAT family N-acetyltransferase n=1 Tax=Sediminispirochaeta bajacaliforniensis TaxID=148 RepID=UPI0003756364|nr:GNAT family N-acetyltransferase [Sediminispirochaeta bajacaliforniensis]
MIIQKMEIDHYAEVKRIWTTTDGMGLRSIDDSKAGIEKFLLRNPNTNFICKMDNSIVGVILSGHDGRRGYIYHTAVKKEFRKQGIGKKLVEEAILSLRNEGINKVALVVFKNNSGGNSFWKALGFEERSDLIYRNLSLHAENI